MKQVKTDDEKKATEVFINSEENEEMNRQSAEEPQADMPIPESENGSEEAAAGQESEEVSENIEAIISKMKELEEQNLRIRAEFANFKRRVEREQGELADYIKSKIFQKLLPILDDFKMMIEKSSTEHDETSILEGAKMIYEKFSQVLEKEGLKKIEALGEKFDPQLHDALMMQPIEDKEKHERIVEVYQDGYQLHDKLIRPSKVVVGKYDSTEEKK